MKNEITLKGKNGKLSAILTSPDEPPVSGKKLSAVLFLHGFGTDKNEVHSLYEEMTTMLEIEGIICLQIDFYGYGESDGRPEDSTVDTMIADAKCAFEYLTNLSYVDPTSIGIVGFSLGAAVAMLLTQFVSCRALALFSPTLNLANDFTAFLGQPLMDELSRCEQFIEAALSWRKINIGRKFYKSLFQQKPLDAIKNYHGALFCIAGEKDFSAANAHNIHTTSPSSTKSIEIVNCGDHISIAEDNWQFLSPAHNALLWLGENLSLPISTASLHIWHSLVTQKEIDIQNIVNNACYLQYFDRARIAFMLSRGVDWEEWHKNGYNFVLAHVDMSLKFPLKEDDLFYVASSFERSGHLKILFKQKIFLKSDDKLIAEATNTVVCVSIKNSKPVFPVELEDLLFPSPKSAGYTPAKQSEKLI